MAKKTKALHKSLEEIFRRKKKTRVPQRKEIPEVFLNALTRWEKGFVQLRRNIIREIFNLKGYWGYFVMICVLADYKTLVLKTRSLTLSRVFGLNRKYVYKVLKILNELKYIIYTPAKNRYQTEINIAIPKYRTYIRIKEDEKEENSRDKMSLLGGCSGDKMSPLQVVSPYKTKSYTPLKTLSTKDNNRDVVVNFFNQRFKNHQNTLSFQTTDLLLKNHNLNKMLLYINRIPNNSSVRNPAGFLCKALNNNWELSPTKEEVLGKERIHREKESKAQQERDKIERLKFEEAKGKEEQLNRLFNSFPKGKQNRLKDKAIEILKAEYPNTSSQTFNSIIAAETMIMIKVWGMLKKKSKVSKIERETAKEIENAFGTPVRFGELNESSKE